MADKKHLYEMIDELTDAMGGRKKDGVRVPVTRDRRLIELLTKIVDELPD